MLRSAVDCRAMSLTDSKICAAFVKLSIDARHGGVAAILPMLLSAAASPFLLPIARNGASASR